jgi:hypothetical protein
MILPKKESLRYDDDRGIGGSSKVQNRYLSKFATDIEAATTF